MSWCRPHCNAVPVPRPRDRTSLRVPNPDSTLTPSSGGGIGRGGMLRACPHGPSPLGVWVLGSCGEPQDFTPAEPAMKSFSWGRKKPKTAVGGGYRFELMAFFLFACHR